MDTDDGAWVFDSLVCFLNGPLWNAPLQSFIEEKSLIFEPNTNKDNPEYKIIYEEFKNLVDLMLGTYMEDIGITPEQFETACSKQYTSKLPLQFHKNLFEQIWAANDYNVFIRMMCQKNIELQLQALELIKSKPGLSSDLFSLEGDAYLEDNQTNELEDAFIMKEIRKQVASEKQNQSSSTASNNEDDEIEKISSEFENHLQDELIIKKQELDKALETAITEKTASYKFDKDEKEESEITQELSKLKVSNLDSTSNNDIQFKLRKIDEAELKKRQEYLNTQRDKLVAMKKQVREKEFKKNLEAEQTNFEKRPRSAQIATQILHTQGGKHAEAQSLQIRRALAERLRTEVVTQKN